MVVTFWMSRLLQRVERDSLNEYIICYTLDNDIIREKIVKGLDFKKEDVMKEVIKKINENKCLIVKSNMWEYKIKSSLIRYIQVL